MLSFITLLVKNFVSKDSASVTISKKNEKISNPYWRLFLKNFGLNIIFSRWLQHFMRNFLFSYNRKTLELKISLKL